MALKIKINTEAEIPEAFKSEYVKQADGTFKLDVEGGIEDVTGLKSALGKERKRADDATAKLKKFGDLDPDKVHVDLQRLEELQALDPTKEADKIVQQKIEGREKQLKEKHDQAIKEMAEKLGYTTAQLEKVLIESAAMGAITKAKGSVPLLLPTIKSVARLKATDKGYVVEILDKDGNARIGNTNGDLLTIDQYVEEMRQSSDFGRAFEADGKSGSGSAGARPAAGGKKVVSLSDKDAMSANFEDIVSGKVEVTD